LRESANAISCDTEARWPDALADGIKASQYAGIQTHFSKFATHTFSWLL
jgi:hypothetical protein